MIIQSAYSGNGNIVLSKRKDLGSTPSRRVKNKGFSKKSDK